MSTATLLGGRLHYRQEPTGFRTGIEPVLLAACVPARRGQRVLEAGTGAGAASLCLAARIPGLHITAIECDPALAELARANAAANGLAGVQVETADLATWRPAQPFDHALANPPWHNAAATRSADAARDRAKAAPPGLLHAWVASLAAALRHRGTVSLILPASQLGQACAALHRSACGEIALLPLWPRSGQPAKLLIVQAVRQGRGPDRLLPGLVLHQGDAYTDAADAVLRQGAALLIPRGAAGATAAHAPRPGSPARAGGSAPAAPRRAG